jgi:SNF2 family DNA or RNA helicase
MARADLAGVSSDYVDLRQNPPEGWFVAGNVLEPVLFLLRENGVYRARFGAVLVRKGESRRLLARSTSDNWVADDGAIHPLPRDVPELFLRVLGSFDSDNLTFAQLLALQRDPPYDLTVVVDSSAWESGDEQVKNDDRPLAVTGLNANLYPYQAGGIAWMRRTLQRTGGVILADEMGLGKTLQILGLLLLEPPSIEAPALVICPSTLIANWVRETTRFAPGLTVMVHRGSGRARLHRDLQRAQLVISTYDTVVNDLVLFKAILWSYVICDEAQAIKNPDAQRRKAVAELPRSHSIPVTGTPVENHLLDLWSLADFAIPGMLGPRDWFELRFRDTEDSARELALITGPVVLRRRVRDVADDLPERIDIEVPVELGSNLARDYDRVLDDTLAHYPKAGALVATGQLQLFCAHPWLQTNDVETRGWEERINVARQSGIPLVTPKIERTIELLREAFENGRKALLFANFNACGLLLQEAAGALPSAYWGAINGSTPVEERQHIVDRFSEHDGPAVLVLNPRAAGAGLNITAATVVIHYTQVWNPALEQQASARAHRRGQTAPVTVYHLFYVDTVEEVMMERAQRRRELGAEAVPLSGQEQADLERALSLRPATA